MFSNLGQKKKTAATGCLGFPSLNWNNLRTTVHLNEPDTRHSPPPPVNQLEGPQRPHPKRVKIKKDFGHFQGETPKTQTQNRQKHPDPTGCENATGRTISHLWDCACWKKPVKGPTPETHAMQRYPCGGCQRKGEAKHTMVDTITQNPKIFDCSSWNEP